MRTLGRFVVNQVLPRVDSRMQASTRPFASPHILRPHHDSRQWSCVHYGVFIPELPAPYRYLNTMTLIGPTGLTAFDNDYLAAADARNTATVLSSTASGAQHHYRAYDVVADCEFAADGSRLAWGSDLTITADYPNFTVDARYQQMQANLAIATTPHVSWFVRTPVYDHLSLLATYTGTLSDTTGSTKISGLCTVEYARARTHQALTRRPVPDWLKLPVDFFTYQIVNLDERTQLLLTDVRAAGATACRLAHLRTLNGPAQVFDDVRFEVLAYQDDDQVDERGRVMRVPARLRWSVRDNGNELIGFTADVDTPLRYGHGRGYVGAYTYAGAFHSRPITGSGYLEWIDCEPR